MRTMIPIILILFLLLGSTPALAQLPPEIVADSHLLRAEQAIREGDFTRARAEIDKIILLQKEHELDLSEEFHFRSAKAAAAASLPDRALEAVVKYLAAAGRDGPHYVEALELMNQAQDEIAGRTELQSTSPGPPPLAPAASQNPIAAQSEKRSLLDAAGTTGAKSATKCDLSKWNTEEYFKTVTVEGVKACLVAGADLNARDERKRTPLHWAASNNTNLEVLIVLLAAGAGVNAQDEWKSTPLYWAARNKNPAVVEALLAAGANPNTRDWAGYTPLHWAAVRENPAVVEALLAAGVDPNARDKKKNTPLHQAAQFNENLAVVEALLAAGANPNARDEDKNTPLHWAARNKNPAMLKALLAAGADRGAFVGADNRSGTEQISKTDAGPEEAKGAEGVDSYYTLSGSKSVTNPIPLVQTTPSYTKAALVAEVQGVVWLQAVIRKTGKVDSFKVIQGLDHGLDEQAIQEISTNWRFKPGMLDGKPVDVLATIEVQFNLRGKQDPDNGRDRQMQHLEQIHLRRLRTN